MTKKNFLEPFFFLKSIPFLILRYTCLSHQCVLTPSTSSCWAAGTGTPKSVHPSRRFITRYWIASRSVHLCANLGSSRDISVCPQDSSQLHTVTRTYMFINEIRIYNFSVAIFTVSVQRQTDIYCMVELHSLTTCLQLAYNTWAALGQRKCSNAFRHLYHRIIRFYKLCIFSK